MSIKVFIPPEEEAIASKACENTLLYVSLIVCLSKAPENETSRQVELGIKKLVLDSVSKKFGIGNCFGIGCVQLLGILGGVSVSNRLGFATFPFLGWYRIGY